MGNSYSNLNLSNSSNLSNNITSFNRVDFSGMQKSINSNVIIINTLETQRQQCLIHNTISAEREIDVINELIEQNRKSIKIIIYGENSSDLSIIKKYQQLWNLGFHNIYMYIGGLFEWLLLQDIFGDTEFPTTTKINNILIYGLSNKLLLKNNS